MKMDKSKPSEGITRSKGLLEVFRKMNPRKVKTADGLKKGDFVKYKRSTRVVRRVWGKPAGTIEEIRCGRGGALMLTAGSVSAIGPQRCVALINAKGNTIQFSDTRDLKKLEK